MAHDHLCIALNKQLTTNIICTYCQLIKAVRCEMEYLARQEYEKGYLDGMLDERNEKSD